MNLYTIPALRQPASAKVADWRNGLGWLAGEVKTPEVVTTLIRKLG